MAQAGRGSLAVQEAGGTTVLVLRGEHDLATAPLVEDAITHARQSGPVIVDFTDVSFIDSSILAVLVNHTSSQDNDQRWSCLAIVVPTHGPTARLLDLVTVGQVLPRFERVSDATATVAPKATDRL
jgi:anti-anti-sigma factor